MKIYSYEFDVDLKSSQLEVHRGDTIRISGTLQNNGTDLPVSISPDGTLRVGVEMRSADGGPKVAAARFDIVGETLKKNVKIPFDITLSTGHCVAGSYALKLDLVYDGAFWLGKSGGVPSFAEASVKPSFSFEQYNSEIPLNSVDFWRQHVSESNDASLSGITTQSFQTYRIETKAGPVTARSMITEYEVALLYALTHDHYSGRGAVVDLGPLVGVGTAALARGLSQNPVSSEFKRVYSYDLFLMSNMRHFLSKGEDNGTGSCFETFMKVNRDHIDLIVPVPGDFMKMSWTGEPIEILFIDLAKSWDLNAHAVRNFFPYLIPGQSVVVQQDYVHAGEPWVALTMEYMADYFELLYFVYGASAAFRLVKRIPAHMTLQDPRDLPLEEINKLFERAQTRATPAVREVHKCCQAIVGFEKGDHAGAADLVATVNVAVRDGQDVSQEFGPTISGSLKAARKIVFGQD